MVYVKLILETGLRLINRHSYIYMYQCRMIPFLEQGHFNLVYQHFSLNSEL